MDFLQEALQLFGEKYRKSQFCQRVDNFMSIWTKQSFSSHEDFLAFRNASKNARTFDKFFDEALPLRQLFSISPRFFGDFMVQVFMDSDQPDAALDIEDISFNMEITKPRQGHQNSLQEKCVAKFGGSPTLFENGVTKYREALKSNCRPKLEFARVDFILDNQKTELEEAIRKKCTKRHYKQPTDLLLVFEDYKFLSVQVLADHLRIPLRHPFRTIYLLAQNSMNVVELFPRT